MRNSVKKTGYFLITMIITLVLIELTANTVYFIKHHDFYSPRKMKEKIAVNISAGKPSAVFSGNPDMWAAKGDLVQVIHPYVGFVFDPRQEGYEGQISDFGFFLSEGLRSPIIKKSPDKIIIGIFGGSFAGDMCNKSAALLRERLKISGKVPLVLNFAIGGGKQPEQLAILAYMLSLGAEFDMVVNIDGFNEVALPPAENIPTGVYPFYPRLWYYRVRSMLSALEIRQIGYLEFLKDRQESWAIFFHAHKLYRSATLYLIWELRNQRFEGAIYQAQQQIERQKETLQGFSVTREAFVCLSASGISSRMIHALRPLSGQIFLDKASFAEKAEQAIGKEEYRQHQKAILKCTALSSAGYVATGPEYHYESEEQLYHDLARHWQRSSFQMNALCQANDIQYYHFLQPNQYVAGSKDMTAEEKMIALVDNHPYRAGAEKGYSLLRQFGGELIPLGVNFTDLTMIFQDNSEVLYNDSCCHLNKTGYDLIMERIWKSIKEKNDF